MDKIMRRIEIGWQVLATCGVLALLAWVGDAPARAAEPVGGATAAIQGDQITLAWPAAPGETGRLLLDLQDGRPLFRWEQPDPTRGTTNSPLVGYDPAAWVVVGSRVNPPPTPPGMSVFNVFFDSPAQRPHQTYRTAWAGPRVARVLAEGPRAAVAIGPIAAGPFRGEWVVTVYAGTRLVHVEAVMKTTEDARAINYDAGLVIGVGGDASKPRLDNQKLAWLDPAGAWHREAANPDQKDQPHAVRHRAIFLEHGPTSTIACFPPPHQYFFPRDYTDNLATTWAGRDHRGLAADEFGFGVRQPEVGGGRYSPWFNAPPGTEQRLGVFYLLHPGPAEAALAEVLKYTHGDQFPAIPGHKVFSSHYHMAFTVEAMRQRAAGIDPPSVPSLVGVFKGLGVDAVHVAEFHGDGHPFDPGATRLAELDAMFAECRRLSDAKLLMIPGEEANLDLGFGARSGHWLELFPRPVRFLMKRAEGQPFEQDGVYRLRDAADLLKLLQAERGLAWTAHPRIKASNFAPDIYQDAPFFRDPAWLGAAWKAMPADLARPRLGDRALDLLDDMSNWGRRKQVLGEVDVFTLDPTHELYAHMNVNYLKLDRLPSFDEGWQPILDALRAGRFVVSTGEVLLHAATLAGAEFGSTLDQVPADPEVKVDVEWTFPLRFAEVVSGDGKHVYRDRIDLTQTPAFGRQTLTLRPDLRGRKWARFAVWDIAANGAFTQPIWLGGE